MLEKLFHLRENNTTVQTEVMAGITTFMTMAYILAVNPNILSVAGMDSSAVLIATALASFVGTALMALLANYPFALAPGMGLNAYFAYTVVLTRGYSWQLALLAVLVEGIIFIILSLTNVREAIFNAIPLSLKSAVSAGIGLFIAFIGLQDAKLIVNSDATLLTYADFAAGGAANVGAILALIGVLITALLLVKQVKGGILWGILITWILGVVCELAGIYVPDIDAGMYSTIPAAIVSFDFSALGNTFGQVLNVDFSAIHILDFIVVLFSFLFVDLFDTLGTLIGCASKADMLDENGKLPRIKGALLADALATCVGAVLGTSTTTTFVESASGVSEGGRTGLTAMTTGILFLAAIIFSPLFLAIPSFAIAPALIIVGFYMIGAVARINFDDMSEAIPCFLTILAMPLAYSISEGIAIGVISWTLINLLTGKAKEKRISALMYVLTVLFILKYIFL
ncbi:MAG: NCS2 family permease [Butyricicoccaceae bacterium]